MLNFSNSSCPPGCVLLPEAEGIAAALDGADSKSWRLPLPPLSSSSSATSLECHAPGDTILRDCTATQLAPCTLRSVLEGS